MAHADWMVQVPVKDIIALMGLEDDLIRIKNENAQLRREVDGLRNIQSQCMQLLGDLRRSHAERR